MWNKYHVSKTPSYKASAAMYGARANPFKRSNSSSSTNSSSSGYVPRKPSSSGWSSSRARALPGSLGLNNLGAFNNDPKVLRQTYLNRLNTALNAPEQHEMIKSCSSEQIEALQAVADGDNLFMTGGAGTGKSYVIKILNAMVGGSVVTASTGVAAALVGGQTLHSWTGLGISATEVTMSPTTRKRIVEACLLIIDEVSMLSADVMDRVDKQTRTARGSDLPFGGLQVVLVGDFFQLPPVRGKFAFYSPVWDKAITKNVELKVQHRTPDPVFSRCLNTLRTGVHDDAALKYINQAVRPEIKYDDGILPTQLYPKNFNVNAQNDKALDELPGQATIYKALDIENIKGSMASFNSRYLVKEELSLKVGAQVMYLKNSGSLVNGSRGVVTGYKKVPLSPEEIAHLRKAKVNGIPGHGTYPVVKWTTGRETVVHPIPIEMRSARGGIICSRHQLPLALAWALTIHKSQGSSLDRVTVDLAGTFSKGQAYVALSRVTSIQGLCLKSPLLWKQIMVSEDVRDFYNTRFPGNKATTTAATAHLDAPPSPEWDLSNFQEVAPIVNAKAQPGEGDINDEDMAAFAAIEQASTDNLFDDDSDDGAIVALVKPTATTTTTTTAVHGAPAIAPSSSVPTPDPSEVQSSSAVSVPTPEPPPHAAMAISPDAPQTQPQSPETPDRSRLRTIGTQTDEARLPHRIREELIRTAPASVPTAKVKRSKSFHAFGLK